MYLHADKSFAIYTHRAYLSLWPIEVMYSNWIIAAVSWLTVQRHAIPQRRPQWAQTILNTAWCCCCWPSCTVADLCTKCLRNVWNDWSLIAAVHSMFACVWLCGKRGRIDLQSRVSCAPGISINCFVTLCFLWIFPQHSTCCESPTLGVRIYYNRKQCRRCVDFLLLLMAPILLCRCSAHSVFLAHTSVSKSQCIRYFSVFFVGNLLFWFQINSMT